jgi:hypothetical protein
MIERYDLSAELYDVTTRELGCDWCRSPEVTRLEAENADLQKRLVEAEKRAKAAEKRATYWAKTAREDGKMLCEKLAEARAELLERGEHE